MSKTAFIISEYNPMHNGHVYHITRTREITECSYVIAIMSGVFTQRGDASCLDLKKRAECALVNGIDAVVVLPVFFSSASADYFALGAMKVIQALGLTGTISFGAEHDDHTLLMTVARWLVENEEYFHETMRTVLKSGVPYAVARESIIAEVVDIPDGFLQRSNVILGIEYIKNAMKMNLPVDFTVIKRLGADYNDTRVQEIMSASGIRTAMAKGSKEWLHAVPENVVQAIHSSQWKSIDAAFGFLQYTIAREGKAIKKYRGVIEGLENRIIEAVRVSSDWRDCVARIKSKRYTETAIRRVLTSILLGITKEDFDRACATRLPYIELAGVSTTGRALIRKIKNSSETPLITSLYAYPHKDYCVAEETFRLFAETEIRTRQIYRLL